MQNESFKIKIEKLRYQFKKFYINNWPINWANLSKQNLVIDSIVNASSVIKSILVICLTGILISTFFFSLGAFNVLTTRVESRGGDFYEVLVGSKVNKFNPVLESSESEQKINNLLYHPLYRIKYHDFLNNPEKQPEIIPILLTQKPTWSANPSDEKDKFFSLDFELRDDIFWSNGDPITNEDVLYSFQRIQEAGGNLDFQSTFKNYNLELVAGSDTKFRILSTNTEISANPQLIYLANFSPISKKIYTENDRELNNEELKTSSKSREFGVTSGFFNIPSKINSLESGSNLQVDNPLWSNAFGGYNQIVLEVNQNQNSKEDVFLERYIFKIYQNVDNSSQDNNSLESAANRKEVDLYTRFLSSNQTSSAEIKDLTGLNQSIQPTNTFFNLFFNTKANHNGYLGYFINEYLRQYVACNFKDIELTPKISSQVDLIPVQRRFLPLHFKEDFTPNCENLDNLLLEYKDRSVYTIENNKRSGVKRIKVFGSSPQLTLLALEDFKEYSEFVLNIMMAAGLPMEAKYISASNLETEISSKNYHMAFLPVTLLSNNPYPIYGLSGQNISAITGAGDRASSPSIESGQRFEEVLKSYSDSNLQDQESKKKLVEFFKQQSVGVNLFRTKREINYSNRIKNLDKSIKEFISFPYQIYEFLPTWYIETRRKFIFF